MLVDGEPRHCRPFSINTNLIHVRSDCGCLITIDQPLVDTSLAAGGQQFFAVLSGSTLVAVEDRLPQSPAESTSKEIA